MWTTGMLLAGGVAALLAVSVLPAEWADDLAVATLIGGAGVAVMLGWLRWQRLERMVLAAFGWPGD